MDLQEQINKYIDYKRETQKNLVSMDNFCEGLKSRGWTTDDKTYVLRCIESLSHGKKKDMKNVKNLLEHIQNLESIITESMTIIRQFKAVIKEIAEAKKKAPELNVNVTMANPTKVKKIQRDEDGNVVGLVEE